MLGTIPQHVFAFLFEPAVFLLNMDPSVHVSAAGPWIALTFLVMFRALVCFAERPGELDVVLFDHDEAPGR